MRFESHLWFELVTVWATIRLILFSPNELDVSGAAASATWTTLGSFFGATWVCSNLLRLGVL